MVGEDGIDELLPIGHFARLSGLSVHTLRHYDDVGLLEPDYVDPETGYRRYGRAQVERARLIRALRCTDLPVEEVRTVLADPSGDVARRTLTRHRDRLSRLHSQVAARITEVDRFLEQGVTMPPLTAPRPVQIKIAVDDPAAAITFYERAFGFRFEVTRQTEEADYSSFVFSRYGESDFFLLHLVTDEPDRPGPSTFGLLVQDLDASHSAAVEAGGTEVTRPHDAEGMPRCSAVKDPSGNWIWLYQG
jgi:DNA-binding transcriptional MerR regulator